MRLPIRFYGLPLFISLVSFAISIGSAYWLAEHFFFDTFFFKKSVNHGYLQSGHEISSYGRRTKDILAFRSLITGGGSADTVLGVSTEDVYTVVVIGDSVVWGQGVRNGDRFPVLLERQLNKYRPAHVMSLASSGDDMLQYYLYFRDIQNYVPGIDLFVFALVENDLVFNPYSTDEQFQRELFSTCDGEVVYWDDFGTYETMLQNSIKSTAANPCIFNRIMGLLPKTHALYFDTEYYKTEAYTHSYILPLMEYGFPVISPDYTSYMEHNKFRVSPMDRHPSSAAHAVYADILEEEIKKLPSFGVADTPGQQ